MSDLDSKDMITGVNMVHSSVSLTPDFSGEQLLNAILSKTTTSSSTWSSWEVSGKIFFVIKINVQDYFTLLFI